MVVVVTGVGGINAKVWKCIKSVIVTPLVNCINKYLELSIFSDSLRIAKVFPIYKSGSKDDPSNYQLISVLPVISKVFKKRIYKRSVI